MDEEMDFKDDLCFGVKIKSERTIFDFSTRQFEPIQVNFEDDPANEEVFCTFENNNNFLKSTSKSVNPHFIVDSLDSMISSSSNQTGASSNQTGSSSNQTGESASLNFNFSSLQTSLSKKKKIELNDFDPLTADLDTWLSLFEAKMIELDTLDQSLSFICKYLDLSGLEFYRQTISESPSINWTEFKNKFKQYFFDFKRIQTSEQSTLESEMQPDSMTNDEVLDCDQDENSRSAESDSTGFDYDLEQDLSMSFGSSNTRRSIRSTRKKVNYKLSDESSSETDDELMDVDFKYKPTSDSSSDCDLENDLESDFQGDSENDSQSVTEPDSENSTKINKENVVEGDLHHNKPKKPVYESHPIIRQWLRSHYERTENKKDEVKQTELLEKLNFFLKDQRTEEESVSHCMLGRLIKTTFGEVPYYKNKNYGFLKAKTNDENSATNLNTTKQPPRSTSESTNSPNGNRKSTKNPNNNPTETDLEEVNHNANDDEHESANKKRNKKSKMIEKWLRRNYIRTDDEDDLIKLEDITDRLNLYLNDQDIESVNGFSTAHHLSAVFGKLTSCNKGQKGNFFKKHYKGIREREHGETSDESEEEEEVQIKPREPSKVEVNHERYELIRKWVRKRYQKTDDKDDLVNCDELYGKISDYLTSIGKQPETNRVKIGKLLSEVFGGKMLKIRKYPSGPKHVNFYGCLKERECSDDEEDEDINVRPAISKHQNSNESTKQKFEKNNFIKQWLMRNYKRTDDALDRIGCNALRDKLNNHLKSLGKCPVSNIIIAHLLRFIFGEQAFIKIRVGSNMVKFYANLKEKESKDEDDNNRIRETTQQLDRRRRLEKANSIVKYLKANYERTDNQFDLVSCEDVKAQAKKSWCINKSLGIGHYMKLAFGDVTVVEKNIGVKTRHYSGLKRRKTDVKDASEVIISERVKAEEMVIEWLKTNYRSSKSRRNLVKCEELTGNLKDYLKQNGKEVLNNIAIGYLVKKAFGQLLVVRIRQVEDSSKKDGRVHYYAKLKERKDDLDDHLTEMSESSSDDEEFQKELKRRTIGRHEIIKRWLRDNYEKTKNESDWVKLEDLYRKLSAYLTEQNKKVEGKDTVGVVIKKVFDIPTYRKNIYRVPKPITIHYYKCLKEKRIQNQ